MDMFTNEFCKNELLAIELGKLSLSDIISALIGGIFIGFCIAIFIDFVSNYKK